MINNESKKYDQYGMQEALKQARKGAIMQEVPIGAVLIDSQGKVIARGYNKVEGKKTQLAHAELQVIAKATKKVADWRLETMTLYVTLQPCIMCMGAIILSQIGRAHV